MLRAPKGKDFVGISENRPVSSCLRCSFRGFRDRRRDLSGCEERLGEPDLGRFRFRDCCPMDDMAFGLMYLDLKNWIMSRERDMLVVDDSGKSSVRSLGKAWH